MISLISNVFKLCVVILPWPLKRRLLEWHFGYQLAPDSRIGLSWIWPRRLVLGPGARIGHLNVAIHLDLMVLAAHSEIVRGNWITGFPVGRSDFFGHQKDRKPEFHLGKHSAVTKNHHFDCTARVEIGEFSTIGGYASRFLSHSIDIIKGRQHSEPIQIGAYSFVGTDCTVLGGAALPDYSVLGAKSLLNKAFTAPYHLYGGVPATKLKPLPHDAVYFGRKQGFVY